MHGYYIKKQKKNMSNNSGKVSQIIGPVVDVVFDNGDIFTVNTNDEMKTLKMSCN